MCGVDYVKLIPDPEPVAELQQSTTLHYSGYDLSLSCSVSVSTDVTDRVIVTTTWSKDDREYNSNCWDTHITVVPVSLTSEGVYVTSLYFSPLDTSDTGVYQCTAVLTSFTGITVANATVNTSLTVEGKPHSSHLAEFVYLCFQQSAQNYRRPLCNCTFLEWITATSGCR